MNSEITDFAMARVCLILIEFPSPLCFSAVQMRRYFGTIWHNSTINYCFDVTLLSTICVQCKQNEITPSTRDEPAIARCI